MVGCLSIVFYYELKKNHIVLITGLQNHLWWYNAGLAKAVCLE